MDIRLSSEQLLFAEASGDLARTLAERWQLGRGPSSVQSSAPDPAVWGEIVAADILGLRLPEDQGGAGAACLDMCIAVEQFARHTVAAPLLGTLILIEQLRGRKADADVLTELISGTARWAVALSRDLARFATAVDDAAGWDCGGATGAVITYDDHAAVHVIRSGSSIDVTRDIAVVDPAADPSTVVPLAAPDQAVEAGTMAFALTLVSADLLGVMESALEAAVQHATARRQFGQPIGSFQAVQHMLAECLVSVESSRSAVWYAAWACNALDPARALLAARAAKAFSSRCAVEVAEAAVQVHGGMGMTWEARPHVWLRRAHTGRWAFGDESHQYDELSAAALGPTTAPVGGNS